MNYNEHVGKPFTIVTHQGVRYTGIFDSIDQQNATICLHDVYNYGTQDRPVPVKVPANSANMGWINFHTSSIAALDIAEQHGPPPRAEPALMDPAIASMGRQGPSRPNQSQQQTSATSSPPRHDQQAAVPPPTRPPVSQSDSNRSSDRNQSVDTALDRVQASLSSLNVDGQNQAGPSNQGHRPQRQPRGPEDGGSWGQQQQHHHRQHAPRQGPSAPTEAFDISQGAQAFERERKAMKEQEQQRKASVATSNGGADDDDEIILSANVHPLALQQTATSPRSEAEGGQPAGYKKSSFFDDLSGPSGKFSLQKERGRNLEAFGEAGGMGGGYGGGGRGRGRPGGRGDGGGYNRTGGQGGGYNGPRAPGGRDEYRQGGRDDYQQGGGGRGYGSRGDSNGNGRGWGGPSRGRGGYDRQSAPQSAQGLWD